MSDTESGFNKLGRPGVILAAIALSAVGALFYNLLPLILGTAQDYGQLENSKIGFLGSAFFFGYMLSTSSGFFWIRRVNWRRLTLLMTAVAIVSLVTAGFASAYPMLLLLFFIAGASLAIIYGIGTTLVGDLPNASRWFGIKISAEALTGALVMLSFPGTIIARWGFTGLTCGMAVVVFAGMLFAYALPAAGIDQDESDQLTPVNKASTSYLIFSLLVLALFFTGETAAWSFIERMGAESGFNPVTVGNILSVSLGAAVMGSLAVAWVNEKFGYFKPLLFAGLIFFAGLAGLYLDNAHVGYYAVNTCLVMFSVGFGLPVTLSTTAKIDHDGRFVILTVPVIGAAAMIAPGAAGLLTEWGGREPLLLFCAVLAAVSLFAQWFVSREIALESAGQLGG